MSVPPPSQPPPLAPPEASAPPEEVVNQQELLDTSVANLSSPWEFDTAQPYCAECAAPFHHLNRRHHCRLCGKIFCNNCSNQRALVPPSSIVLVPKGGKKAVPSHQTEISFQPDDDPDRMLTYCDDKQDLLYGKGLEERTKLAREPLRVCRPCYQQLQSVQESLRNSNSNAMRYNHIDPTDIRRLFNSPLAFTLGHEVRKAAYTLNNLLPLPRARMGALVSSSESDFAFSNPRQQQQLCDTQQCAGVSPQLSNLDGVRIPARLLQKAKGVAVLTVVKGGFGLAGFEFGTGLVVARLDDGWTAPSAIGTAGISWGALIGAQVSDHVFLLMNDAAVRLMFSHDGSIQLGADVGVALGPLGRSVEADFGASPNSMAPIYTYSLSKGLYAGVSLDGKVLVTRHKVNEKFYGKLVSGEELLLGHVPTPPAAQPLYDALKRCQVYSNSQTSSRALQQQQRTHEMSYEYGRDFTVPQPFRLASVPQPPAAADQHSFTPTSEMKQQQQQQQQKADGGGGEATTGASSSEYAPTIADLSGARPF